MQLYNSKVNELITMLGDRATSNIELDRLAGRMFGNKYHGTYSSDKLPTLSDSKPYCIINVDPSTKHGSHWVGCAYSSPRQNILIYDSFGRKTSKLIPSLAKLKHVDTDYDAEQLDSQSSCGHRALAFLEVFDKLGWDYAKMI